MRITTFWRVVLLCGLMLVILAIAALFRRFGLGELALILAVLSLILVVESGRFIVRQFLKGLSRPASHASLKGKRGR